MKVQCPFRLCLESNGDGGHSWTLGNFGIILHKNDECDRANATWLGFEPTTVPLKVKRLTALSRSPNIPSPGICFIGSNMVHYIMFYSNDYTRMYLIHACLKILQAGTYSSAIIKHWQKTLEWKKHVTLYKIRQTFIRFQTFKWFLGYCLNL